ncbi:tripartite motif-containing protein 59 [Discoglossus pictus]
MDNIEEELTCSICYSIFVDPRILPCSHTFCRNCLENVVNSSENYWRLSMFRLTCPSCRGNVELPPTGVRSLPINYALKSIVEKYNPTERQSTATCTEHLRQPLNVFCLKDRKLVCGHCLTVGQHQGHPIDDLQSAYLKERETASKLLVILSDKEFTGVSSVIKKLEDQMAYCKRIVQEDKRDVLNFFEKLTESLEQKKQNLLATLNGVNQQIADVYSPQIEKMKEIQDEELDLISLSSSTQEEESPLVFLENIHNIHQRMKALKKQQLVPVRPVVIHPRIGQVLNDEWLKTDAGDIHTLPIPTIELRFDKIEENIKRTNKCAFIFPFILLFLALIALFILSCNTDTLHVLKDRYWTYLSELIKPAVNCACDHMYSVQAASLRLSGAIQHFFTHFSS